MWDLGIQLYAPWPSRYWGTGLGLYWSLQQHCLVFTSFKGGVHMHCVNVLNIHKLTQRIWVPPLMEVLHYSTSSTSSTVEWSKHTVEQCSIFYPELPHVNKWMVYSRTTILCILASVECAKITVLSHKVVFSQMIIHLSISGVARVSKLRGHSMGTLSTCITHICYIGNLGHTPAMSTLKSLLRSFLTTNTIHSVLPVCSL